MLSSPVSKKIPWLTNLYPIPVLPFEMQTDVWFKKKNFDVEVTQICKGN